MTEKTGLKKMVEWLEHKKELGHIEMSLENMLSKARRLLKEEQEQKPQRQDSTRAQLIDVMRAANKMGCYDAADVIQGIVEQGQKPTAPMIGFDPGTKDGGEVAYCIAFHAKTEEEAEQKMVEWFKARYRPANDEGLREAVEHIAKLQKASCHGCPIPMAKCNREVPGGEVSCEEALFKHFSRHPAPDKSALVEELREWMESLRRFDYVPRWVANEGMGILSRHSKEVK